MRKIVLLGGGGHCKSCIEVIEAAACRAILGILGLPEQVGRRVLGYQVIGTEDDLRRLAGEGTEFLVSVGQIRSPQARIGLFELVRRARGKLATVVARSAVISKHSEIGAGTIVMNHALVNSDSAIGANCIINNFANIEHDAQVGDHCHISTGALVNGEVTVGSRCFIGSGAVLSNGISVCPDVVLGAGSVVLKDITQAGIYGGNPATFLKDL